MQTAEPLRKPVATNSPQLLDKLRLWLRTSHDSYRTEQAYVRWVEKFLRSHRGRNGGGWRYPAEMGEAEGEEYLTFLAVQQNVALSAQNQAFSALVYFWSHVLERKLPEIQAQRAEPRQRLPVVLFTGKFHGRREAALRSWVRG